MRKTCHGCASLEKNDIAMSGVVYSCKATGRIVPHQSQRNADRAWETTFWRVPLECPLAEGEVIKSAKQAPASEWVTITTA
jgi:hypothetical protein